MKTQSIPPLFALAAVLAVSGCAAPSAQTVDPQHEKLLSEVHAIHAVNEQRLRNDLISAGIKPAGMNEADFASARKEWLATASAFSEKAERDREVKLDAYFTAHPQLTEAMRKAIRNQWFALGMSREDVEFSMGHPRQKIQAGGNGPEWETWYYPTLSLDFSEGKVSRWIVHSGS